MNIIKVDLTNIDMSLIKELYLQHHHGDCFNELFKLSISDKVLKVHTAIDVNGFFQFAAHPYKMEGVNVEISWNKKTNECLQFLERKEF